MARNAIKSEFRTSKIADVSHFVRNLKKIKVSYGSEMTRNAIESEIRTSKMADVSHFVFILFIMFCIYCTNTYLCREIPRALMFIVVFYTRILCYVMFYVMIMIPDVYEDDISCV